MRKQELKIIIKIIISIYISIITINLYSYTIKYFDKNKGKEYLKYIYERKGEIAKFEYDKKRLHIKFKKKYK